jgi:hypothetical protein
MKRNYSYPEVHIAQIALASMILAGSPAGSMNVHTDTPTDEPW